MCALLHCKSAQFSAASQAAPKSKVPCPGVCTGRGEYVCVTCQLHFSKALPLRMAFPPSQNGAGRGPRNGAMPSCVQTGDSDEEGLESLDCCRECKRSERCGRDCRCNLNARQKLMHEGGVIMELGFIGKQEDLYLSGWRVILEFKKRFFMHACLVLM
jgi:hypothetical protein